VKPWLTLYHWDLPQELEDAGGWPARATASRFAEYAALVADALGDRVENWTTLNEPWCSAFLGYGSGHHAPGRRDPAAAVEAAHHLLLGHGLAVQALRARGVGKSGLTLNLYPVSPASDEPGDLDAARRIDGLHNRLFLDSIFRGRYPDDVLTDLRGALGPSVVKDGDLAVIAEPLDLLGVNYYFRHVVAGGAYPGVGAVDFVNRGLARTAIGWEIDPTGLIEVLTRVHADYTDLPIYVTENGAAFDDEVTVDGIDDLARTAYLAEHIDAAAAALEVGVPLKGYFVWSLLDNFEWAWGYEKRFGIVYVDYPTQRRAVKSSGRWYADLIRQHRSVAR
jgi:beta-glucosidase